MSEKEDIEVAIAFLSTSREYLESLFKTMNSIECAIFKQEDILKCEDEVNNALINLINKLKAKKGELNGKVGIDSRDQKGA
jgi:hypothetical protein